MSNRKALLAETLENLRLAGPVIVAQLAGVGMGAVDTLFAGRLGPQSLAAVAIGVNLNVVLFVLAMGVLMACSPIIAQMRGRERPVEEIADFMRRARLFSLGVALLWFLLANALAGPAIGSLHLNEETARIAIRFERALSFSSLGFCLWFVQRFCAEGAGDTRPVLASGLIGLAGNVVFDWLLLFGHGGLPALGVMGCGVATSISSLLMAATLALGFRRSPRLKPYSAIRREPPVSPSGSAASQEGLREILRIGVPIGCIMLAEAGLFVLAALLMARFGDDTVAAYQVAINVASLLFMIPLSIGQATTVRVGLAIGAGERAAARLRGKVGMVLGLFNAASNAAIIALFAGFIVAWFTHDPDIGALSIRFLLLAAAFQFFDGLQVTANGALRGLKDTRIPMILTILAYWVFGLPIAWWLGFHTDLGPSGLWWGLTAGLGLASLGLSWRFLQQSK